MGDDALRTRTAEALGDPGWAEAEVAPVAGRASKRHFWRLARADRAVVVMAYPPEPAENLLFAGLAPALGAGGIPVPAVLAHDRAEGLLWLEDAGQESLWERGRRSPEARPADSLAAVQVLAAFHRLPPDHFARHGAATLPGFDADLYRFEHHYLVGKTLIPLAGIDASTAGAILEELRPVGDRLLRGEETWIHRDFQSQNLLIDARGDLRVIDFQGLRRGSPWYDLAALVHDPYLDRDEAEVGTMVRAYAEIAGHPVGRALDATREAGVQRLSQALGAYGKLSLVDGLEAYRAYIPVAARRLARLAGPEAFPTLHGVLGRLCLVSGTGPE